jgi:hypothetical protein
MSLSLFAVLGDTRLVYMVESAIPACESSRGRRGQVATVARDRVIDDLYSRSDTFIRPLFITADIFIFATALFLRF